MEYRNTVPMGALELDSMLWRLRSQRVIIIIMGCSECWLITDGCRLCTASRLLMHQLH